MQRSGLTGDMRLDDYKHFVAEEFIKDLRNAKIRKEELLTRLSEISELPAIENETGVRSGDISDPTAKAAAARIKILIEIEEIKECEEAYEYALECLPPTEREFFLDFTDPFQSKRKVWEKWKRRFYLEDTALYGVRNRILAKFGQLIDNHYLK